MKPYIFCRCIQCRGAGHNHQATSRQKRQMHKAWRRKDRERIKRGEYDVVAIDEKWMLR